jgi:hypothetical protein
MHKDSEPAVMKLRVTEKTWESDGFPLKRPMRIAEQLRRSRQAK